MSVQEEFYTLIGKAVDGAEESAMFGKPCFKAGGKAFACFFRDCMVFKLGAGVREEALSLPGSQLFDPSAKQRPMKEWVQVPYEHKAEWKKFAEAACNYVRDGK